MKKLLLILPLIGYSSLAMAEFPIGKVGVRVSPKIDVDINTMPQDGDGNGIGAYAEIGSTSLFGYADIQRSDLDILNASLDFDETRFGAGARTNGDMGGAEVRVERYQTDIDMGNLSADDDGTAVHLGGTLNLGERAALFGSYGFIAMSDFDGSEFQLGVRGNISAAAEIYAAYRMLDIEDDSNMAANSIEIEISDIRLGVNLLF